MTVASAATWVGTEKKTRKLKNVIRSDGNGRIELLGSYFGCAREEDQSSVLRNVVETDAIFTHRGQEALRTDSIGRLSACGRSIRRPDPGGDRQPGAGD